MRSNIKNGGKQGGSYIHCLRSGGNYVETTFGLIKEQRLGKISQTFQSPVISCEERPVEFIVDLFS